MSNAVKLNDTFMHSLQRHGGGESNSNPKRIIALLGNTVPTSPSRKLPQTSKKKVFSHFFSFCLYMSLSTLVWDTNCSTQDYFFLLLFIYFKKGMKAMERTVKSGESVRNLPLPPFFFLYYYFPNSERELMQTTYCCAVGGRFLFLCGIFCIIRISTVLSHDTVF